MKRLAISILLTLSLCAHENLNAREFVSVVDNVAFALFPGKARIVTFHSGKMADAGICDLFH